MSCTSSSVPLCASMQADAPGYQALEDVGSVKGPLCWKCDGKGLLIGKQQKQVVCKVCLGRKRLSPKRKASSASDRPGRITSRRTPVDWSPLGPKCVGQHTELEKDVRFFPSQGEELCCLIGEWRIYQRYGGHRWTTDDLVTAYVGMVNPLPSSSLYSYTHTHSYTLSPFHLTPLHLPYPYWSSPIKHVPSWTFIHEDEAETSST